MTLRILENLRLVIKSLKIRGNVINMKNLGNGKNILNL